jgi:hypothetical protein
MKCQYCGHEGPPATDHLCESCGQVLPIPSLAITEEEA